MCHSISLNTDKSIKNFTSDHKGLESLWDAVNQTIVSKDQDIILLPLTIYRPLLAVNLLNMVISLLGIVGNVINMVNFSIQGFGTTMNISLFNLALSDLCMSVTIFLLGLSVNPWYMCLDQVGQLRLLHMWNITSYLAATFACVSAWTSVIIALERCLCIAKPMTVKKMFKPKALIFVYVLMYAFFLCLTLLSFIYMYGYVPGNILLVAQPFIADIKSRPSVLHVTYLANMASQDVPFLCLPVLNILMVKFIRRRSHWTKKFDHGRSAATLSLRSSDSMICARETRVLTLAVLLCTVCFVCFIPVIGVYWVAFCLTSLTFGAKGERLFLLAFSFAFLFAAVNASVNILIYYKLSAKYRAVLRDMFKKFPCLQKGN